MRLALALALLSACGPPTPILAVELTTDLRPAVDFVRVRSELSESPFAGGGALQITQVDHPVEPENDYADAARVAQFSLSPRGDTRYLRVSLLDASGRIRAQRLATVDVSTSRVVSIVIGGACRGVQCAAGTTCVNGACVDPRCLPEAPERCEGATCESDAECASGAACQEAVCRDGGCLLLDACPSGQICEGARCVPAPRCGDGRCDPGSETPCGCASDCGGCPPGCGDGVCDAADTPTACPEDCGPPPPACGDGICEVDDCAGDCMSIAPVCGDGRCEGEACPEDCAPRCGNPGCTSCAECDACCDAGCGDGACSADEASSCGCPGDCGPCPTCDGVCQPDEPCPEDCPSGAAVCGDDACVEGEESCGNCQTDCGGWCGVGMPAVPYTQCGGTGSARESSCGGFDVAWTQASVNVGYYPMTVGPQDGRITTELRSAEPGAGILIAELDLLTLVAIQSTRNPGCDDAPHLRPAIDGWVFGYVRAGPYAGAEGWMRARDLVIDEDADHACANGPTGEDFQAFANPYSDACDPLPCAGERPSSCRATNPADQGAEHCGGALYDPPRTRFVTAETLQLRYAPAGAARRYLHRGDEVAVLYRSPVGSWVFVHVRTTQAPRFSPVGSRGWVLEEELSTTN